MNELELSDLIGKSPNVYFAYTLVNSVSNLNSYI